jgi:hypothetical protein
MMELYLHYPISFHGLVALTSPTSGGHSVGIVRWRTSPRSLFVWYWIKHSNLTSATCLCAQVQLRTSANAYGARQGTRSMLLSIPAYSPAAQWWWPQDILHGQWANLSAAFSRKRWSVPLQVVMFLIYKYARTPALCFQNCNYRLTGSITNCQFLKYFRNPAERAYWNCSICPSVWMKYLRTA